VLDNVINMFVSKVTNILVPALAGSVAGIAIRSYGSVTGWLRKALNEERRIKKEFMADLFVSHKPYEKKSGVACFAPYVGVIISSLAEQNPDTVVFDARIDTGADITCIPKAYASKLGPLIFGNLITVRGHDGNVTRVWTYRLTISIMAYSEFPDSAELRRLKSYRPEKGVLLTDSSIGLIGMDIIGVCRRVTFDSTTKEFFIEC